MTDGLISLIRNALLETRDSYIRPTNITAQWQQVWSPSVVNETKLGLNRSALTRNDVGLLPAGFGISGFTSGQPTTYIIEKPTSYSVVDNLIWVRGRHTLKLGGEVRRIHLNVGNGAATTYTYASQDAFLRNQMDRIAVNGELGTVGVRRTLYSAYAQDEIKLKPELTLNVGIRYEYYTVSNEAYGRGRVFDIERCQGFCQPGAEWFFQDQDNIAPRISLAWSPKVFDGKTVIRTWLWPVFRNRAKRRRHGCDRQPAGELFSHGCGCAGFELSGDALAGSAHFAGTDTPKRAA